MKSKFVAIAILSMAVFTIAYAQPSGRGAAKKTARQQAKGEDLFAEMKSAVGITAEQEPKVRTAIQKRNDQLRVIREEIKAKYPNRDERKAKREQIKSEYKDRRIAIHKEFKSEMKNILDNEQFEKWKKFRQAKRDELKSKREAARQKRLQLSEDELDRFDEDEADTND